MSQQTEPVALITGAAQRLGAATARHLHAAGYRLAIHHHHSTTTANALCAELNAVRADSAFTLCADLAPAGAAAALVRAFSAHSQRLDVLVNNASVFERHTIAEMTETDWDRTLGINARTPFFLALACAPLLRASHGAVINITDIHASRPRRDYAAYCVSKAALKAATEALATELAPEVRVNAIAPGAILWAASEDDTLQQAAVAATALARAGEPDDIAAAVLYLARASYVTGQTLSVDGGRTLNM